MARTDVLIFAEDPGAANFIGSLPGAVALKGKKSVILADGLAIKYFRERAQPVVVRSAATSAKAVLSQFSPKIVVVGTSENRNSLGLQLIDEAKALGIMTVGAIDRSSNAELRFRGRQDRALAHCPDLLLVPDLYVKRKFEDLGFPSADIHVCGDPHLDYVRMIAQRLKSENLATIRKRVGIPDNGGRQILLFLAEPPSSINPGLTRRNAEYNLSGTGFSSDRCHIVLEEVLHAVSLLENKPFVVVRMHPKNSVGEFSPYFQEINLLSVNENPLEIVYAADLVIGMTTTLLMEARIMSRPTLSVLPRELERDWLPSVSQGLTPSVVSRQELVRVLRNWSMNEWEPPEHLINPEIVFPPGAIERVAEYIMSKLN